MSQEVARILNALKKKIYSPVYFFYGEEPFYIDELTRWIENNVLDEAERGFNQTVVYGRDVSGREVVDLACSFPMMGNYQVIIVKEAQSINTLGEPLLAYLKNPLKSTLLVINYKYKKLDKRKALYKTLSKSDKVVLFESAKLYDNKIPAWISGRVHTLGFTISPKSVNLLAEYLGTDLGKINNELGKLIINLEPGEKITEDHIEQNIGISKEFNIFEFNKALGKRDMFHAYRILQYFEANPKQNPLQMVSVMLYTFFMKTFIYHQISRESKSSIASKLGISPFFVDDYRVAAKNYSPQQIKKIIAGLRQIDLKSKGLGSSDANSFGPLKELVFQLMS